MLAAFGGLLEERERVLKQENSQGRAEQTAARGADCAPTHMHSATQGYKCLDR